MSSVAASSAGAPNRYADWRRSGVPVVSWRPLPFDLSRVPEGCRGEVRERCFEYYKRSCESYDQAIADAALAYVHQGGDPSSGRPGPLLLMARQFSRRIYTLCRAHCQYEMDRGIPMLPVDAGQLKNHRFNTSEILRMQESCKGLMEILEGLADGMPKERYEYFLEILTSPKERKRILESKVGHPLLLGAIRKYEALKEKDLIDRACSRMFTSGQMSGEEVERQLSAVARMVLYPAASLEERLNMEIRHRVAGDGSSFDGSPGCLGTNPFAYRNLILQGDPENPIAEFRALFFYVYMNKHFIDACMQDEGFLAFANSRLEADQADWRIDPEFTAAMNERGPKSRSPIFRFGPWAMLNSLIRDARRDVSFYQRHPRPLLHDVMRGRCSSDASFRHRLSPRELVNQAGDPRWEAVPSHRTVKLASGGSVYRLKTRDQIEDSPEGRAAKQYLEMCDDLGLPFYASISGTYDLMAAMGGFVGVVLSQEELETFKAAMVAFMVPAKDHSVHEILQSGKSYGLPYEPGPGYERFVYPPEGARFLERVEKEMQRRGQRPPAYYLTAEYAGDIYRKANRDG